MKSFQKLSVIAFLTLFSISCASTGGSTSPSSKKSKKSKIPQSEIQQGIIIKNQADLKIEVEQLGKTMETLIGKLEENNFFTQAVLEELKSLKRLEKELGEIKMRMAETTLSENQRYNLLYDQMEDSHFALTVELENIKNLLEDMKKKPAPKKKPKKVKSRPVPSSMPAEDVYRSGYNHFMRGKYAEAVLEFTEYMKRFPNTDLSDNSQFWIGESLAKQSKNENAIAAFLRVAKNYPSSSKAPTALLRASELMTKLGNKEKAVETLEKLKQTYPDSYEAAQADANITELNKKQ